LGYSGELSECHQPAFQVSALDAVRHQREGAPIRVCRRLERAEPAQHIQPRHHAGFFFLAKGLRMARDVITLGDVADRGAEMIEIRCGRCDRSGRLSVVRLLAEYGPQTPVWEIMDAQIGDCPKREAHNIAERCSVHCPDLSGLFRAPEAG
jgi:hypothetical protein